MGCHIISCLGLVHLEERWGWFENAKVEGWLNF